ncbi:uncharacterized protein L3040_007223 [Drepanopeziza brunnea f. sp. 'multigermtubi']|uniref:FYVE-type domain-containing protein n=1 Tax=Marssonina brunnea f. sp. multigermtubi (strain MB_m1) TaxID=1072389 RepID=K1WN55_MARBU|nr:uncharacterized protein MBM_02347 [Drepanopeziza brunnea f. sp. 'multigermtubi' MB_m1]EKD19110.1 hypothetical protein MBM_02347 [Drepanopeziza brunnea f. sp. 'multigermtubi' MB_m1]KAJ5038358.1 hypothetical protein L3040_007223 [Drepanopeziza brunnea f. sp. 'multigermtubi']
MFLEKSDQQISILSFMSDNNPQRSQRPTTAPMANGFAMPVQPFTASPTQYTLFNSQQTPPINPETATPSNTSPTSPRSGVPAHVQQQSSHLRPRKSPMYVPAVLRATEPPRRTARQSPLTPPLSKDNNLDEWETARTLSRKQSGDSGKSGLGEIVEAEWSSLGLGEVTALPTRKHWKPDAESAICDDTTCHAYFGLLSRKHHCRRCGNIFCGRHSSHAVPLDQDANYHPEGAKVRACEYCYGDYLRWKIALSSRSNSESSDPNEPPTPTVSCPASRVARLGSVFGMGPGEPQSLAASVPRDWHWSTF